LYKIRWHGVLRDSIFFRRQGSLLLIVFAWTIARTAVTATVTIPTVAVT
jgi:hypothetical protein